MKCTWIIEEEIMGKTFVKKVDKFDRLKVKFATKFKQNKRKAITLDYQNSYKLSK